jgi:MFS family permease
VSHPSRWMALGVLCASLLAIVIDNTIVNVAIPTLVRDLNADVSELQRVDAYTLVFAGLLLLAGALADRFGRRRTHHPTETLGRRRIMVDVTSAVLQFDLLAHQAPRRATSE